MQFLEYYQIIRERIWLALLTMALGAGVVIAIQLLPEGSYQAQGKMYVSPNAQQEAQQAGNDFGLGGLGDEFWQTLQDTIGSRYVVEEAARQIGLQSQDLIKRLVPLASDRPKRSRLLIVTGTGSTAEQAKKLTDQGMVVFGKYWNERRLAKARQISTEMAKVYEDAKTRSDASEREVRRFETTGIRMGKPPDTLLWAQQEINTIEGQLSTSKMEEGLAQDRITSLITRSQEEARKPASERSFMSPENPLTNLENQLSALQTRKAELLARRTPQHPDVKKVEAQIAALQKQVADTRKKVGNPTSAAQALPPALQEQILGAQLSLRESQRRNAALVQRQSQLRSSIPVLQEQAARYQEILKEYQATKSISDAVKDKLKALDAEIRRLETEQDVTVVDKAVVQTSSKTKAKFMAKFIGATIGGFVVGLIFIFLLHNLDMTFKDELEAEQMVGAKVLTAIPRSDVVMRDEIPDPVAAIPPPPGETPSAE